MRTLHLQSDAVRGEILARYFELGNIACTTMCTKNKSNELPFLNLTAWDVVVVDLDDGAHLLLDNLYTIRAEAKRTRAQILTICAIQDLDLAEQIELYALQCGADDHLPWPKGRVLFCERVRNLARRKEAFHVPTPRLVYEEIELYTDKPLCLVKGKEIRLTGSEIKILELLMQRPQWVYSRPQLINYIGSAVEDERSIDSHVKRLRKKIYKACGIKYIDTRYSLGYTMEPKKKEACA